MAGVIGIGGSVTSDGDDDGSETESDSNDATREPWG